MPQDRTPEKADELADLIASGLSVSESCVKASFPRFEFYRWCRADEEFATRIARAREQQQEAIIDELRELADSATPEDWQVKRLQIWQRQWEASKLAPKKYGDRVQTEHSGQVDSKVTYSWAGEPPKTE